MASEVNWWNPWFESHFPSRESAAPHSRWADLMAAMVRTERHTAQLVEIIRAHEPDEVCGFDSESRTPSIGRRSPRVSARRDWETPGS